MLRRLFVFILVILFIAAAGSAALHFWPHDALPADARADLVVVEKSERTLTLMHDGKVLKTYRVALGRNPQGHKVREGDKRTPEGRYVIDGRNQRSGFHLALNISYPNAADRKHAASQNVSPGGEIMVHGIKNGLGWLGPLHRLIDWTNGCVAVTNDEIREIWRAVPNGTAIEIREWPMGS